MEERTGGAGEYHDTSTAHNVTLRCSGGTSKSWMKLAGFILSSCDQGKKSRCGGGRNEWC